MINSFFYLFSILIVISAILMVLTKNILYSAFLLLLIFLGISGIYVLLGADFLAVSQVIIYVGGILVLLLFGIMLTTSSADLPNLENKPQPQTETRNAFLGFLVSVGFFILLILVIFRVNFSQLRWLKLNQEKGLLLKESSIPTIGVNLMTDSILAFEGIAILLLVALIGALLIAGRKLNI